MKLQLSLVLLLALFCFSDGQKKKIPDKVFGGNSVTKREPFMASLRTLSGVHYCGGTLIHPRVVLTAAHCIKDKNRPIDVDIGRLRRVGSDSSGFLSYKTVAIHVHEGYNPVTYDNDVAVLVLNVACPHKWLPLADSDDCFESRGGCDVRTLGWGDTEKGYFASILQEAFTKSVARGTCQSLLGASRVSSRMICAGEVTDGGIDSCQGDSGGPLIQNDKQVGIVSFGVGCGEAQAPGVYTSVPKLKSWIESKIISAVAPRLRTLGNHDFLLNQDNNFNRNRLAWQTSATKNFQPTDRTLDR